jgi:hypothetical protein
MIDYYHGECADIVGQMLRHCGRHVHKPHWNYLCLKTECCFYTCAMMMMMMMMMTATTTTTMMLFGLGVGMGERLMGATKFHVCDGGRRNPSSRGLPPSKY